MKLHTDLVVTGRVLTYSKDTLARNPELLGAGGSSAAATQNTEKPPGHSDRPARPSRIRQSRKPLMNRLESEFLARLKYLYPGQEFHPQAKRFKLANGLWYKPDFTADACKNFSSEVAWEVKGPHSFRGGFENLKMAAHQWPNVQWWLVWKEVGEWQTQEVLP